MKDHLENKDIYQAKKELNQLLIASFKFLENLTRSLSRYNLKSNYKFVIMNNCNKITKLNNKSWKLMSSYTMPRFKILRKNVKKRN